MILFLFLILELPLHHKAPSRFPDTCPQCQIIGTQSVVDPVLVDFLLYQLE